MIVVLPTPKVKKNKTKKTKSDLKKCHEIDPKIVIFNWFFLSGLQSFELTHPLERVGQQMRNWIFWSL